MLATSKNVLFPGHNHLLSTNTDDPTLWLSPDPSLAGAWVIISLGSSVPVVSRWLWPGNMTFSEVASMVAIWWIVAFCAVSHLLHTSMIY